MDLAREKTWWELPKFLPWKIETPEEQAEYQAQQTDGLLASPLSISISQEIKTWSQERQLNPILVT